MGTPLPKTRPNTVAEDMLTPKQYATTQQISLSWLAKARKRLSKLDACEPTSRRKPSTGC